MAVEKRGLIRVFEAIDPAVGHVELHVSVHCEQQRLYTGKTVNVLSQTHP